MKNKFLQSSKGLLHRSFDPSKCKTSLRLAGSRLKLLRNKKDVQVKQMKREISQLLESGQDQTARIRVEHVIREEKMMAAYDLLEIYCELVVARLPIIESQKNCPIDLKEAIASLVFASPRCGDVPELLDVRKQLSAKYGKDFTTAAIELRPQCGVGNMLVEKLSATAPDLQTKLKILSAIADEYNVKWESNSVEEISVPPSVSQSGPSRKESEVYVEPPRSEATDVQDSPINSNKHSSPLNSSQQDSNTPVGAEKFSSVETSSVNTTFQPERKSSAPPEKKAELFQGDNNASPVDTQRWTTMEFKDAAEAAQVAAEAAERASMAAKAAVELSSAGKISRQNSTEPCKPDVHIIKDEGPETHQDSEFSGERFSEPFVKKSSTEHSEVQNEQIDGSKLHELKTASVLKEDGAGGGSSSEEYNRLPSPKSKVSVDDDSLVHGTPIVDDYSQNNSLKKIYESEVSTKKQSIEYVNETANSWPEKTENLSEEKIVKQPSVISPSSTPIDDYSQNNSLKEIFEGEVSTKKQYVNETANSWPEKAEILSEEKIMKQPSVISPSSTPIDDYSQNNSLKEIYEGEVSTKKQSIKYENETANSWPEKAEILSEEKIVKQPSVISPASSQSSIYDNVNVFANDFCEDPTASVGKSAVHEEAPQTSFHETAAVDFDRSDSGIDDHESDTNPFVGVGKSVVHLETSQTSFHESAAVADFDKSDSDIDDDHEACKSPTYDEQSLEFHMQLLGQKSPELQSVKADSWIPTRSSSRVEKPTSSVFFTEEKVSPVFQENTTLEDDQELDAPVMFDDSDGAASEIDEDISTVHDKVEESKVEYSSDRPHKHKESGKSVRSHAKKGKAEQSVGSTRKDEGNSVFDTKPLSFPSDDELNSDVDLPWKTNRNDNFGADSSSEEEVGNESSVVGMLNFGKLTGGLRHKSNKHRPFIKKNRLDESSSDKEEEAEISPKITRSTTPPPPVDIGRRKKSSKTPPVLESDSDSDSSEEDEPLPKRYGKKQAPNTVDTETSPKITRSTTPPPPVEIGRRKKSSKAPPVLESDSDSESSEEDKPLPKRYGKKQAPNTVDTAKKPKPSLRVPDSFGSDSSDTDDDFSNVSGNRKKHHVPTPVSRRTKVSPPKGRTSSHTKIRVKPEAVESDTAETGRKSKTSNKPEAPKKSSPKPPSMPAKSNYWAPPTPYSPNQSGSSEQPTPAKAASNKPNKSNLPGPSEIPSSGKATSTTVQDGKAAHKKSSAVEEPSSSQQKPEPSIDSPGKQDGAKKASHVHPKLPDYDTLFETLRANRP
ncbi:hypothetical protein ACP275_10G102800 [Erythranthe tilingii]